MNSTQYMYVTMAVENPKSFTFKDQQHRVGVIAFKRNEDETVTVATSMVSKSEPHGFNQSKGVNKAMARLALKNESLTFKKFEILNGYPLQQILADLGQRTENNHFHNIDWDHFQSKFERTLRQFLTPQALKPTMSYPYPTQVSNNHSGAIATWNKVKSPFTARFDSAEDKHSNLSGIEQSLQAVAKSDAITVHVHKSTPVKPSKERVNKKSRKSSNSRVKSKNKKKSAVKAKKTVSHKSK